MRVEEYKEKFVELFKQLQEEHGRIKGIEMYPKEIMHMTGEALYTNVICKIVFE